MSSASTERYREARLDPRSTPWRAARFAVVDLETTGLDPARDEIISWAVVPVDTGRVVVGATRQGLIRPHAMPTGETIRIHGLRAADLERAPPLAAAIDPLLDALAERRLVAHVAAIERGFLSRALGTAGVEVHEPIIDTARLASGWLRHQRVTVRHPIGLGDLARRLGLPVHRPHHADGDALTTAQVFVALASHLEGRRELTVRRLERLSARGGRARPGAGLLHLVRR